VSAAQSLRTVFQDALGFRTRPRSACRDEVPVRRNRKERTDWGRQAGQEQEDDWTHSGPILREWRKDSVGAERAPQAKAIYASCCAAYDSHRSTRSISMHGLWRRLLQRQRRPHWSSLPFVQCVSRHNASIRFTKARIARKSLAVPKERNGVHLRGFGDIFCRICASIAKGGNLAQGA